MRKLRVEQGHTWADQQAVRRRSTKIDDETLSVNEIVQPVAAVFMLFKDEFLAPHVRDLTFQWGALLLNKYREAVLRERIADETSSNE